MAMLVVAPLLLLLIGGGVFAVVWLVTWLGRRRREAFSDLELEVQTSGSTVLIPPEPGSFRGAKATYGRVKCDGAIALTDEAVHLHRYLGEPLLIPLSEIVRISQEAWFLHSYRGGHPHLVLHLRDENEVGLFVGDPDRWQAAIAEHLEA